ncbi:Protein SMG7L [Forsythia ovata]|uniref:Protein SMG7L n=1 Tax=Forsythia ovata TaxID=205694 RepID=A0ABD1QBL0_9LAMI
MNSDRHSVLEDQRESQTSFLAVVDTEKQLLASIYSKGLLHSDTIELYQKVRAGYEEIILNNHQLVELQEVEYLLWKLHYKHIDEFRKRIRQLSSNAENTKTDALHGNMDSQSIIDRHLEGFKSFLFKAAEFYRNLIVELRKSCGLPAKVLIDNNNDNSFFVEPTNKHKCEYACHRFLVCLGDLARYTELIKKPDAYKWSTAATYYLEATRTWPDSGNPHNQLALLATYVGDSFLALYHCVRSLAVKEPFPDAWNNLMLLLEKNRSSHLHLLSRDTHIDFSNPSERCSLRNTSQAESASNNSNLEGTDNVSSGEFDLWPMFVRMMSFFLVKSSLEDFPCALASFISRLEALLALDNAELKAALESYQQVDSSRRGPYRAVQLVCVLIFVVNSLTQSLETKESTERDETESSAQTQYALAATFTCMGRVTERCLKGDCMETCPLFPAVLVFVEWLAGILDRAEAHGTDGRVTSSISYFFGALVDFLNRFDQNESEIAPDNTALWEDHELRGFYPVSHAHALLEFTSDRECITNFDNRNLSRFSRIFDAAMKIVYRSDCTRNWILYDQVGRKFDTGKMVKNLDGGETKVASPASSLKLEEPSQKTDGSVKGVEDTILTIQPIDQAKNSHSYRSKNVDFDGMETLPEQSQGRPSQNSQPTTTDEEEVILFNPITRHNSVPLYVSGASGNLNSLHRTNAQTTLPDEWLRRSTSLTIGQSLAQTETFRQREPPLKESATHPAGPPSLNAWVLSRESLYIEREKGQKELRKQELSPIEEIASTSFTNLSINETKDSEVVQGHVSPITHNSPPYVAPLPSAPLIPDDAVWFMGNSSSLPKYRSPVGNEADGILGAAPNTGYTTRSAVQPFDGYPPLFGMSSSEWLYHYRNSHNMEHANNHISPAHFNAPTHGSFYTHDVSRFDFYDQWGNPLAPNPMIYMGNAQLHAGSRNFYGSDEQRRDVLSLGNQRSFPYVCGVGTDLRSEQPPLLQYLKEREWQLQPDFRARDPTFM